MPFIQFQFRKGTTAEWSGSNPVLASAELGVETDSNRFKIGNGVSPWNSLPYVLTPFPYTGSAIVSGSLVVAGSVVVTSGITGSISGSLDGEFPYQNLTGIPIGIVSSSQQIATGSFTGSFTGSLLGDVISTNVFNPFLLAGM